MTTHVRARTYAEAAQELTEIDPRRTGRTLDLLARALDLTDGDIHRLTGISRPTINQKRTGAKPIRAADLWPLAEALGVDIGVLLLPPAEALQWLIDNRRDVLDGDVRLNRFESSSCTVPKLNRSLLSAKLLARTLPGGIRAAA